MEFTSKVKNKVLSGQSREIIHSVHKFMKEEGESGCSLIPVAKVQERVAKATGVSIRTVRNISQESRSIKLGEKFSFSTPNKKRKVIHTNAKLDDFERELLRKIIINFYITDKMAPSKKKIHQKFCLDAGYLGSIESLRKEIHKIGFRWRKTRTKQKLLLENHNIRKLRLIYLTNIKKFRDAKRSIVYMDDTFINTSHTATKNWSNDNNDCYRRMLAKSSKGLIIIHDSSDEGFINVSWRTNIKTGDCHDEVDFSNYKEWFQTELLPNLPPQSVLIVDSSPYHNKQVKKCPSSASRKEEMQDWLRRRNIPFQYTQSKTELYGLIKLTKPAYKQYEIDTILHNKGHDILRLPPYHPNLNPIEQVWASLKRYIVERSAKFDMAEIQKLCTEFFESLSINEWTERVKDAVKCEDEFREQDTVIDNIIDDILFTVGTGDSDSSDDLSSDSDSEEAALSETTM